MSNSDNGLVLGLLKVSRDSGKLLGLLKVYVVSMFSYSGNG